METSQINSLLAKIEELLNRLAEKDALIDKLSQKIENLTVAANKNTTATIFEQRHNTERRQLYDNKNSKRAYDEVSSPGTDEDIASLESPETFKNPMSKKARRKAKKAKEASKLLAPHDNQISHRANNLLSQNRFSGLSLDADEVDDIPNEDAADLRQDMEQAPPEDASSQQLAGNEINDTQTPGPTQTQAYISTVRIPPIILRNKDKYMKISNLANTLGINVIKAKTLMDGIAFHPQTELDYRKLVRLFDQQKVEYHTYQLPSEKLLYVVLKGIPEPIDPDDVKEELVSRGFHPVNVSRMRSRKDKRVLHMVLVTVPKVEKTIYNLKDILGLVVTVEDQKSSNRINQCHRCQRFGHAQSRCTALPKCVKCAGNHLIQDCTMDKQTPPKCANCNQQHPASYRGCSAWPKIKSTNPPTNVAARNPNQTYAQITNKNKNELNFSSLYENFRIMHAQMLEMTRQLGQMFQDKNHK